MLETTLSVVKGLEKSDAKVLLIDNFDSFSFNLVQYLSVLTANRIRVCRADKIDFGLMDWASHIVLSPGPGKPSDAKGSIEVLERCQKPVLGVCLGFQVIVEHFGGKIEVSTPPVHGKADYITHSSSGLFNNLPSPMQVGRYHSLACTETELEVTARNHEQMIMAVKHPLKEIYGVQFHPESILTLGGERLLHNFLVSQPGSL